jgi:hypothetical protein
VKHFESLLTPGSAATAVTAVTAVTAEITPVKPTTIQNMVSRSEDT